MTSIRVVSYNIRSMRDDRAALGRVITSLEPDVVCVQEAPRFLRWRSTCAALARMSGLVVVTGGRPAGANLIMSTLGVDVLSTAEVLFSKDPRLHQRGTAIAVLRRNGANFAVAGTHLDVVAGARLRHVGELEAAIGRAVAPGIPVIVAGDINDRPGSAVWSAMCERRSDAVAVAGAGPNLTSNAANPHQRIDGVFVDPAITIRSAGVLDNADTRVASDHLPVIVDLDLPD